jgi:threonine aldolase
MTSFESDYNNGAHPDILRSFLETNDTQSASYGYDQWSESARKKIRKAIKCPDASIFFLSGGTQANSTIIDGMTASYEGVVAVQTAHINVHESGAVESFGHKVITLPSHNGKMNDEELLNYLRAYHADPTWEHMVYPGMVYITFPTELGTIYKADEIDSIYCICQKYKIPLFIDGARLGYGLASSECDFDISWLAHHCDAFYIGGTKVGALCGEAVVFPRGNAPRQFFTIVKRHGALLAKSRLTGVQFNTLFSTCSEGERKELLYFHIAHHAIDMAMQLRQLFKKAGIPLNDSPTNQQFVTLTHRQIGHLRQQVAFETWEPIDDNRTLCRFVTSWATTDDDLSALATALQSL